MKSRWLSRRTGVIAAAGAALALAGTACQVTPTASTATSDYSLNVWSGWVQRWNPCAPVHYRVNSGLAAGDKGLIAAAVKQVSQATGITFVYDGGTTYVPRSNSWASAPAPLVISFARHQGQPGGTDLLTGGNQLGEGGFQSQYLTSNGRIVSYKIVKGYAVIDAGSYAASTVAVRRAVLLHELGHAVGLNHARLSGEVMYPAITNASATAYSVGDRNGLAKVGRSAGCLR